MWFTGLFFFLCVWYKALSIKWSLTWTIHGGLDTGHRWARSPDCFNEATSKTCSSPQIYPFVYDKRWKVAYQKKMSVMFIEPVSVKFENVFCWRGTDYCGKYSLPCIHKTKRTAFLFCQLLILSFLFLWNGKFKCAGM